MNERERIKAIDSLVDDYVKAGCIDNARETASLGGRNLTTKEIDSLVYANLKKGWLITARKAVKLGASQEAIDSLIKASTRPAI